MAGILKRLRRHSFDLRGGGSAAERLFTQGHQAKKLLNGSIGPAERVHAVRISGIPGSASMLLFGGQLSKRGGTA